MQKISSNQKHPSNMKIQLTFDVEENQDTQNQLKNIIHVIKDVLTPQHCKHNKLYKNMQRNRSTSADKSTFNKKEKKENSYNKISKWFAETNTTIDVLYDKKLSKLYLYNITENILENIGFDLMQGDWEKVFNKNTSHITSIVKQSLDKKMHVFSLSKNSSINLFLSIVGISTPERDKIWL